MNAVISPVVYYHLINHRILIAVKEFGTLTLTPAVTNPMKMYASHAPAGPA